MSDRPLLSICIPAYNYAHYLPETIESCLSQEEEFELIVIDNCSTDGTPELRTKYEPDPRVRWFRNEELLPIEDNWNESVRLTSGEYVKLLQADDKLLAGSIGEILSLLRSNSDIDFFGHLCEIIDQDGVVNYSPMNRESKLTRYRREEALRLKLRQSLRFREPSQNVFRKSVWERVGGYPLGHRAIFDLFFNVELMASANCAFYFKPLSAARRHSDSDGAKIDAALMIASVSDLCDEILKKLGDDAGFLDVSAAHGWFLYQAAITFIRKRSLENMAIQYIWSKSLAFLNPAAWFFFGLHVSRRVRGIR